MARGALSSWWSSLATPEEATPPAEPAMEATPTSPAAEAGASLDPATIRQALAAAASAGQQMEEAPAIRESDSEEQPPSGQMTGVTVSRRHTVNVVP